MRWSLIGRAALFALLLTSAGGADCADESPRISFNAVAIGALGRNDLGVGMLEARATLSPHLIVTAAPAIVSASAAKTEYQLRTAATLLMPLGPVQLDDRNLWVFSDAGTTRYRNRLRITAPLTVTGRSLRIQLLDEIFHEEGGRHWFRNMLGGGVGWDVTRFVSVDAYWMRVDEDDRDRTSLLVVSMTAELFRN